MSYILYHNTFTAKKRSIIFSRTLSIVNFNSICCFIITELTEICQINTLILFTNNELR